MRLPDTLLARRHVDPALGVLVRGWGCWRGQVTLEDGPPVPLVLAGWRSAPDPARVRLAQELVTRYVALQPAIARALFEQHAPYGEAVAAGEEPPLAGLPRLTRPDEVWASVTVARVLIERMGGLETVEIAYRAAWDEEHTLGARFQRWALVELNGSVLA